MLRRIARRAGCRTRPRPALGRWAAGAAAAEAPPAAAPGSASDRSGDPAPAPEAAPPPPLKRWPFVLCAVLLVLVWLPTRLQLWAYVRAQYWVHYARLRWGSGLSEQEAASQALRLLHLPVGQEGRHALCAGVLQATASIAEARERGDAK
eukprot:TRINITY_DN60712_c0_g1_i1.p4 TRINITY_DN60712_c0_g1~~TRINITY_DN60712_c0_g1_i1.p4  ORF type:complete len:174 (+),score=52.56 TRINITY_DN60712_c0_g1_i1:73-522(+)